MTGWIIAAALVGAFMGFLLGLYVAAYGVQQMTDDWIRNESFKRQGKRYTVKEERDA